MSQKFKIDTSKFIYYDEYIENDIDFLDNVSVIRQEETKVESETVTEQISTINLNSEKPNPKD
jgi:hypothetical protein